nr:MAG TPA: hypothetical protein [Caudoviricetes sp.]DAW20036.1 MAG TPA: hypothetical protein [Caudoviricetes sp.]DAW89350.1 MAG TPA: hypothetical protein [Caudoviricetes sp.]
MKIEYTSSENDKHVGRKYIQQVIVYPHLYRLIAQL